MASGFASAAATSGLAVQTPQPCREGRDIPGYQNTVSGTQFAFSSKPGDISRVLGGEDLGTIFLPDGTRLASRKHWIAYVLRPKGALVLDKGACRAVLKNGKSLLPSGILEVRGNFRRGEPVQCLDESGILLAVGLTDYNAADLARIQGINTSRIEEILGYKDGDEVIHRDNLVIL